MRRLRRRFLARPNATCRNGALPQAQPVQTGYAPPQANGGGFLRRASSVEPSAPPSALSAGGSRLSTNPQAGGQPGFAPPARATWRLPGRSEIRSPDRRYRTEEKPGTIVIDTPNKFLYLVEDGGKALRYGIGVGRPGFTWAGIKTITAKREWPDWRPPADMLQRRPDLPRYMPGGIDNPLGARAMYLGSTLYRSTARTSPGPSAPTCRRAASACATTTSPISTTASRSAPRSW